MPAQSRPKGEMAEEVAAEKHQHYRASTLGKALNEALAELKCDLF